jgi:hypothetical protein
MAQVTDKKYEFAGTEFVAAFDEFMKQRLAGEDLSGVDFGYVWLATNAPEHLRMAGSADAAWNWQIRDGKTEIRQGDLPKDKTDFLLKCDYEDLRQWMAMTNAEDSVFMAEEMPARMADGRLVLEYQDACVPVIGKYIMLSDWRDSFFSQHIA